MQVHVCMIMSIIQCKSKVSSLHYITRIFFNNSMYVFLFRFTANIKQPSRSSPCLRREVSRRGVLERCYRVILMR